MSVVVKNSIDASNNAIERPQGSAHFDCTLSHRSRKRIKELGEVFTPEASIVDMLKLLDRSRRGIWGNENITFFEPCCGHGNMVVVIYRKRLQGLYKKALQRGEKKPAYYAVANAINSLWAIDIDPLNITHCRARVLATTMEFIKEKTGTSSARKIIAKETSFFGHLLCAINWHIHENETLSSLSGAKDAETAAGKTQAGHRWFRKYGHRPLNFQTSWTDHFKSNPADKIIRISHRQADRWVKNLIAGKQCSDSIFQFADFLTGQKKIRLIIFPKITSFMREEPHEDCG
ncbi:MAG: hypothetical protein L3J70_09260 [Gammaproteobacteria bacterium]|nr:hypothetical protein [Gammaproteobacteria bacterium]